MLAVTLSVALEVVLCAPGASAYLYFTNAQSGTIARANLDGSGVNQSFISLAPRTPYGLAVSSSYIYWANGSPSTVIASNIGRANIDGSAPDPNWFGVYTPWGVAIDSSYLYYASTSFMCVGRANLDGSSSRCTSGGPAGTFINMLNLPTGLAVDSGHVYWSNTGNPSGPPGTIGRANIDGSAPDANFITAVTRPWGIAVDGAHIYWADSAANSIGRANLDGSGPNDHFITGASSPYAVAVDGAHIYWTNFNSNTIGRANLDGSGVNENFITGANGPVGIAVDALGPGGTTTKCVVPNVKGKSLRAAKSALTKADCSLGKVIKPKRGSNLVVHSESPVAGKVLAAGSKVKLTLAPKKHP